jgi:hypothetical protein
MHSFLRLALASLAFLACTAGMRGQTAAPLSPDRVTFFTEPNFKGEALAVEAGAAVENLERMLRPSRQPWIFAISSVRVDGAARATVYTGPNFTGDRLEITQSISDLYSVQQGRSTGGTWDRAIASVSVAGPQRVVAPPSVAPVRTEPPPTTVVVVPTPAPSPPPVIVHNVRPRLDRRSAELIVQRAYREVLNRPADPDGLRTYRDRLIHEGWSEQQIIQQLQRSGEARAINADEAINRAYREVLGRDADSRGLAHYRAKWRDGWTQGQIRDDLRRSQEGRNSNIHNAIVRAYRELLGRDPDPSGYSNYERGMRERGWSERDVRQNIMASEEYRNRAKAQPPGPGRGR